MKEGTIDKQDGLALFIQLGVEKTAKSSKNLEWLTGALIILTLALIFLTIPLAKDSFKKEPKMKSVELVQKATGMLVVETKENQPITHPKIYSLILTANQSVHVTCVDYLLKGAMVSEDPVTLDGTEIRIPLKEASLNKILNALGGRPTADAAIRLTIDGNRIVVLPIFLEQIMELGRENGLPSSHFVCAKISGKTAF